jgi:hypothetical protein
MPARRTAREHAWLLNGFWDSGLQLTAFIFDEETQKNDKFLDSFLRKRLLGLPLSPEEVPRSIRLDPYYGKAKKLQRSLPTFNGPGMMVREDVAAILRRFRLGQSLLHPMPVQLADGSPAPCPPYFMLCVGEQRVRVVPELSPGLEPDMYNPGQLVRNAGLEDPKDTIVLRPEPDDVDLWCDPQQIDGFYYSDAVHRALSAAGFGRAFKPLRCRVLALN